MKININYSTMSNKSNYSNTKVKANLNLSYDTISFKSQLSKPIRKVSDFVKTYNIEQRTKESCLDALAYMSKTYPQLFKKRFKTLRIEDIEIKNHRCTSQEIDVDTDEYFSLVDLTKKKQDKILASYCVCYDDFGISRDDWFNYH